MIGVIVLMVFSNRSGSLFDIVGVFIIILIAVLGFFFGHAVWSEIRASDADEAIIGDSETAESVFGTGDFVFDSGLTDNMIFGIFIGSVLVVLILAVLSSANPIFLFLSIPVSLILVLLSVIFNNWYGEFSTNAAFAGLLPSYPKTTFIFDHFPLIIVIVIVMIIISIFVARRSRGGGFGF